MESDEREICLCFHVGLGKLAKFYRMHRPRLVSEFAHCHGAGTGCGWCVPYLQRLFEQMQQGQAPALEMSGEEYRRRRIEYHRTKKPELPPPPDAAGPLELDLDQVLSEIPDDLKLD